MNKKYLRQISILILIVLIASGFTLSARAASGAWVAQTYVQGPADNPLKGFLPWQGNYTNFPHSMEFNSFAWSDVQTGTNTFNWTAIDTFLNDVSSRGHQAVFRFYADYPNRPYGVPGFLSGVAKNAYTDYSNCSTACSYSPNYDDATLITAMTNFIAALGARYDGDARVAFVQTGLVGFWGEWHTYRDTCACDTWMPSTTTINTILQAFDNAFSTTKLVQRLPMGNSINMNMGYHDDSFNYSTYGATTWYFWPLMTAAGAQNKWRTEPIGGELRPEIQLSTWQNSNLCVTGAVGDQQCFNTSVDTTHSSWQLAHQLFSPGNNGPAHTRAIDGAKRQGYDLFVSQVALPDTTTTGNVQVDIKIQNKGVAPFYYNWPVQLAVADSSNAIVATWNTPWDLRSAIDQGTDVQYSFTKTGHGLAAGTYKLLMRAVNPLSNGKPLVFANQKWGLDVANWLTLDTFTVASGPTNTPGGPTVTNTPIPPTATPTKTPTPTPTTGPNLALNKTTTTSSVYGSSNTGAAAVDGNVTTYWRTQRNNGLTSEWITVDLGSSMSFNQVVLKWGSNYAKAYTIRVSPDNSTWTTVYTATAAIGGNETINFNSTSARYVQMNSTSWFNKLEHVWLYEFEVH